jgi:hypothetical protein
MDMQLLVITIVLINSAVTLSASVMTVILIFGLLFYARKADLFLDKMMRTCEEIARLTEYMARRPN